ncbi:membrane protein [Acetobacter orientalis]|uniref:Membrane protein n=1 Tax=Acetobacter orientalis TaxID=146474 RepID=A0A2Z5ZEI0_9PROT|nr:membrane protein [Acetobacter orientalis]
MRDSKKTEKQSVSGQSSDCMAPQFNLHDNASTREKYISHIVFFVPKN